MRSDFRRFRWALLTSLLGLAVAASAVRAQNVNNEALTRAKMWMESYEAGIPVSGSIAGCGQISYPRLSGESQKFFEWCGFLDHRLGAGGAERQLFRAWV